MVAFLLENTGLLGAAPCSWHCIDAGLYQAIVPRPRCYYRTSTIVRNFIVKVNVTFIDIPLLHLSHLPESVVMVATIDGGRAGRVFRGAGAVEGIGCVWYLLVLSYLRLANCDKLLRATRPHLEDGT